MSTVQASGLGSGLDVNSIVTQLVAAERAPAQQRLDRAQSGLDTKISALGTLRGALSTFQTSVEALRKESLSPARRTEVSDATVLRATAKTGAATGTYSVEVLALATAHKIASQAYAGGVGATVGTGTLTFGHGDAGFDVVVAAGTTLAQLRDSINNAAANGGIRASIVQADDGARLVLTATASGSAQAIRVTAADAQGGLDSLVFDPGTSTPMSERSPAADAQAKIEGFLVSAAGNTIASAVQGVSFELLAAKPGTSLTVSVSEDTAGLKDKIGKAVSDFNAAASTIARLRAYDPATRAGGALVGDAMLLGIESRVRRDLAATVAPSGTAPTMLAAIGISMGANGRLEVDDAKLAAALRSDAAGVTRLFAGEGGIAKRLATTLDGAISAGGQMTSRTESLQAQKRDLQKARETLELRMQALETRYRTQFTSLDSLLSGLQSTGNYLARQLR
ncbi:MAG: flagellar filament capping protein FliD [Gammaproteobacteria bacterium]